MHFRKCVHHQISHLMPQDKGSASTNGSFALFASSTRNAPCTPQRGSASGILRPFGDRPQDPRLFHARGPSVHIWGNTWCAWIGHLAFTGTSRKQVVIP
jgi:hypothetical protein